MNDGNLEGVLRSIINAGWDVKSDGQVEANTGYFAVVEIPTHEDDRTELRDAVFPDDDEDAELFDALPAGWFFVVEDANGNVSYSPERQEEADRLFDETQQKYLN
jgi:hypothetical protein